MCVCAVCDFVLVTTLIVYVCRWVCVCVCVCGGGGGGCVRACGFSVGRNAVSG